MSNKAPYQTTFEIEHTIQPIYTGGSGGIALDRSGRILATTLGEDALLTDLDTGRQLARIEGDGELISTLSLTPSASHMILCSRLLSMQIYALKPTPDSSPTLDYELQRTLKPHTTPVVVLAVDHTGTLLATGAADGVIKVWDIQRGFTTHTFRGPNVLVSALLFFELAAGSGEEEGILARNRKKERRKSIEAVNCGENGTAKAFRLASGNQDGKVRIWDLHKKTCAILDSHVSDVRALDYSPEENALLTASRDRTIMIWDAKSWKVRKTIPVLEEIEAAGFLDKGRSVYTGGATGNLRVWQCDTGREVTETQESGVETDAIVDAILIPDNFSLLAIRADHTLGFYSTSIVENINDDVSILGLPELRRISGTHDEIIDLGYLMPDHSLLALATNSEEIRIVSLQDNSSDETKYFGADIAQLRGHEDIIICLSIDWSGHWLATGAKDNTAKLWRIDPSNNSYTCYATFTGHAESIGAIALPSQPPPESSAAFKSPLDHPPPYLLTGSQDQTIKRWEIPKSTTKSSPRATYTRKAHEKDINSLDISPNSSLFASASQDRLVKIWSTETGETTGILRGHRRGVWSVKFALKDTPSLSTETGSSGKGGMILTGSGDQTLKIWSLSNFTCLLTFEGHTNSVLKVCWLNPPSSQQKKPIQIASAGGDGLVKIWDANTDDCACTLDNHIDRIWALAVHPTTNTLISGGGDSVITFWKDTSAQTVEASSIAATAYVENEQRLMNYMQGGNWREAIILALQLGHPGRLLALFKGVIEGEQEEWSWMGNKEVDKVVGSLGDDQLWGLLGRCRDWNTNVRTKGVAQRVLGCVVRSYGWEYLVKLGERRRGRSGLRELVDGLRVYTERHYKRVEELADESWILEYTLGSMDGFGGMNKDGNGVGEMDEEMDVFMV